MDAGAVDADEDAVVNTRPIWILLPTIKTYGICFDVKKFFEDCFRILKIQFTLHICSLKDLSD